MHKRLISAFALSVLLLSLAVGYLWHAGGTVATTDQLVIRIVILVPLMLSAIWLLFVEIVPVAVSMLYRFWDEYQKIPEEENEQIQSTADQCYAASQGEDSWYDILRSCF